MFRRAGKATGYAGAHGPRVMQRSVSECRLDNLKCVDTMIKDNLYATSCYTLLFCMIIRPELIVLTVDQITLHTVFKDDFFLHFHFSFRLLKLKFSRY